ncbi:MAG: NUDIX hydrolase [Ruminococcaceae bacterium]|nr:NUDIX hydrolase [Oscillospiraceae bacterium]
MELFEKKLDSTLIFDGKVVHLYKDKVGLPDGSTSFREYVKHLGAVCVIPVTDENEVILVKQYRYAVGEVLTEIPAGKLDFEGEDPLSAAKRELLEETGAIAENIIPLGIYYGSPAIMGEKIHMYLATGLSFKEQHLDEDEFLEVTKIPLADAVKSALDGTFRDGKTQSAILRAAAMLSPEIFTKLK